MGHDRAMPMQVRVELEIEIERGQPIRGVVREAAGAYPFAGWLELNSALEAVCQAAGEGRGSTGTQRTRMRKAQAHPQGLRPGPPTG